MTLDFSFVNEWVRSLFPDTVINFSPLTFHAKMLQKQLLYDAQQIQYQATRNKNSNYIYKYTFLKSKNIIYLWFLTSKCCMQELPTSSTLKKCVCSGKHISLPHLLIKCALWVIESPLGAPSCALSLRTCKIYHKLRRGSICSRAATGELHIHSRVALLNWNTFKRYKLDGDHSALRCICAPLVYVHMQQKLLLADSPLERHLSLFALFH